METQHKAIVTEAVGVFDGYRDLVETVKELRVYGFGRHQISVRGSDAAVRQSYGDADTPPELLEDSPRAPRSPLISIEELGVAQGVLIGAAMYLGAALGFVTTDSLAGDDSAVMRLIAYTLLAGGLGGGLAWLLGINYRKFFQHQAETGGLVLWVETPNVAQQVTAESILKKHGAHDVHFHDIPIAA
jgi:hypothetical protein